MGSIHALTPLQGLSLDAMGEANFLEKEIGDKCWTKKPSNSGTGWCAQAVYWPMRADVCLQASTSRRTHRTV